MHVLDTSVWVLIAITGSLKFIEMHQVWPWESSSKPNRAEPWALFLVEKVWHLLHWIRHRRWYLTVEDDPGRSKGRGTEAKNYARSAAFGASSS